MTPLQQEIFDNKFSYRKEGEKKTPLLKITSDLIWRDYKEGKRELRVGLSLNADNHDHSKDCTCKPFWHVSISVVGKFVNKWNDRDRIKVKKKVHELLQGVGEVEQEWTQDVLKSRQYFRPLKKNEIDLLYFPNVSTN